MSIRFQPNRSLPDDLGNDPAFRRMLLSKGIAVRKGIAAQLPVGRTGGRRVAPFARQAFAEPDGTGRDVSVAVGTRWRLGHIIEFGSARSRAYAPVQRAALAAGLRFQRGRR
jgi:hypothetical protein